MLIKPLPTDHSVLDIGESLVNIVTTLVTDTKTTGFLLPAKRTLRDPAITTQLLPALNPSTSNARHDPTLTQTLAQLLVVVALVRIQLLGPTSWPTTLASHRRDNVHRRQQFLIIRNISSRKYRRQRQTVPIYHLMTLGAGPAPIHRRRANRLTFLLRTPFSGASLRGVSLLAPPLLPEGVPPFSAPLDTAPLARTVIESTLARLQLIRCAACSFASRISWSLCQTSAFCQSLSLRQQVPPIKPHA